jgi:RNA polymerase sigma-70 factor (ECF subfamily)
MAESRFAAEPAIAQPADTLYDRGWAAVLLERALAALKAEFERSGKLDLFKRFKGCVLAEQSDLSYTKLALELGLKENAVRVAAHRLRQRYGELLRAEVAQTVSTPAEANEELRYLVSVIRDNHGAVRNNAEEKL